MTCETAVDKAEERGAVDSVSPRKLLNSELYYVQRSGACQCSTTLYTNTEQKGFPWIFAHQSKVKALLSIEGRELQAISFRSFR